MTRIEYDLLRKERPELKFVHWLQLSPDWRTYILSQRPERLIAIRSATILRGDEPTPLYYGLAKGKWMRDLDLSGVFQ